MNIHDLPTDYQAQAEAKLSERLAKEAMAIFPRQQQTAAKPARKGKMNANISYLDGHCFRSDKEKRRYITLKSMLPDGIIKKLDLQVPYKLVHIYKYYADFVVVFKVGHIEVEDVKGCRTQLYKQKNVL